MCRQANLRFKQQEFNMLKEKLPELDEHDGLGALETGIGRGYLLCLSRNWFAEAVRL